MKSLFVHVGPHKTATTSLQHFLFSYRRCLLAKSVCYPVISPNTPHKINHNDLAIAMQRGETQSLARYLEIITLQGAQSKIILISGEEFSNCINNSLPDNLSVLEESFSTTYVFVRRNDKERFASALMHNLASNLAKVLRHGGIQEYVCALMRYSGRQQAFYMEKGAIMLDFDALKDQGVGKSFLKDVCGVETRKQDVVVNTSKLYLSKIFALPYEKKAEICHFFHDDTLNRILLSRDAQRSLKVTDDVLFECREAIRSQVQHCIGLYGELLKKQGKGSWRREEGCRVKEQL